MAKEYHVRVRLKAGPFEVDGDTPSVIRADDLRGQPGLLERLTGVFTRWQAADGNVKKDNDEEEEKEE